MNDAQGHEGSDLGRQGQASELLQDLFQHTSDLIQIIGIDGSIQLVNPAWCRALGYSPAEAHALNVFALIAPDCLSHCQQVFQALMTDQPSQAICCVFLTRAGRRIALEGQLDVRFEGQQPVAVRCILRDVTARQQAEEALRELNATLEQQVQKRTAQLLESQHRLQEAQRLANVGHWELDLLSGELIWSDQICRIHGLDPATTVPSYAGYLATVHPDDRQLIEAVYAESLQTRQPYEITYRLLLGDGQLRHVISRVETSFDENNQPLRSIGTTQDITLLEESQRNLQAGEQKLRSLFDMAPLGVVRTNDDGDLLEFNASFCKLTGYAPDELRRLDHFALTPESHRDEQRHWLSQLHGEEDYRPRESEYRCKDGSCVPISLHGQRVLLADGSDYIWLIVENIATRRQAEANLQQAASVFRHASEGILITDPEGVILDVNQAFSRITGYGRDEVIGANPRLLKSGHHSDAFYAEMWGQLCQRGSWSGEVMNRGKDGSIHPVLETISAVNGPDGSVQTYVALMADIRQIKEQQHRLEQLAHFDLLTGLPNRLLLSDRLQHSMAQARRHGRQLALCYIDLDGFKEINDRHGHAAGDHLLRCLAQRMKEVLRQGDTVARLGGDEFVAVFEDAGHLGEGAACLQRLLAVLQEPVSWEQQLLQVTASMGIALYPNGEAQLAADQLLRHADQAMYDAKRQGKSRQAFYSAELHGQHLQECQEVIGRMGQALENGEFELHYQPIINLDSHAVAGVEALIRWRHPEDGLLPPDRFLPQMEGHRLEISVGNWVIATALHQFSIWKQQGVSLPISINLSPNQLEQPDFLEQLEGWGSHALEAQQVNCYFEVMESAAFVDFFKVRSVMQSCAERGIRIALDDFGTGLSSLRYLRELPTQRLKIDRSFVRGMSENPEDLAIVQAIVALAKGLGLELVAEGVECADQAKALRGLGVELAQGFLYAPAMPEPELRGWLANWSPPAGQAAT